MIIHQYILLALFLSITIPAHAQTLIVGNKREHTVSLVDLETGQERARLDTGRAPHEVTVAPDGSVAVVVSYRDQDYTGNTLHVFDVAEALGLGEIKLGTHRGPHGLKWIPGTRRVIVTTEVTNDVVIVDVDKRAVVAKIATDQSGSHMLALSPDGQRAYVANIHSGSFTVLDLVSLRKVRDVRAGRGTEGITASPDGEEIWVGNNNSRSIVVFDAGSFERLTEIDTEGVPIRVEMSPDGNVVAVSVADQDKVDIYDAATRQKIHEIDVSSVGGHMPVTLLFSSDGSRLWVATTQAARVIEINTEDWTISRVLKAGAGSDGLGYSGISGTR